MSLKLVSLLIVIFLMNDGYLNKSDLTNNSINEYNKAKAELDSVFQNLIKEIKEKHSSDPYVNDWIEQINKSQNAWEKYLNEEEVAAGFFWRGGGTGRAQIEWATKLTLDRIENLKMRYNAKQ